MDATLAGLAFFVLLAFTSQALSGFGSIIIAVTLGSILIPIKSLLPIVVPLDVFLSTYIVISYRTYIRKEVLLRRIVPFMMTGLVLGLGIFGTITGDLLKRVYGAFVILISLRELIAGSKSQVPLKQSLSGLFIFLAGFAQGLFASGGPLLAYATGRMNLSKEEFRSSLCVVWLTCNTTLTLVYLATGRLNPETARTTAVLIPMMLLGGFIGEKLHVRINEKAFRVFVYSVLTMAGIAILVF